MGSSDVQDPRPAAAQPHLTDAGLRWLIEHARDGVSVHREGRFVFVNLALARMFGFPRTEELIGKRLADVLDPRDEGMVTDRVRRMHETGEAAPLQIFRAVRADGTVLIHEASSQPILFGGTDAILTIVRDVSDRMRLQQSAVRADRLEALGRLASGVAHEVNNPLAFVSANVEHALAEIAAAAKLLSALPSGEAAEARRRLDGAAEALAEAGEGTERVSAIIRRLRSFTRDDGGRRSAIDVRQVAESAVQLIAHEASGRARLELDLQPAPLVDASEARIAQLVLDLLHNALSAIAPAGAQENMVVRLRTGTDAAGRARIEVSDTGVGIPPEHLDKVFDPFFTTRQPGGGAGLGLSACHAIVTELGGEMGISSEPGRGTQVWVALPEPQAANDSTPPRPT